MLRSKRNKSHRAPEGSWYFASERKIMQDMKTTGSYRNYMCRRHSSPIRNGRVDMARVRCGLVALLLLTSLSRAQTDSDAQRAVHTALDEMGGEANLRNLKSVRFQAMGHRNLLEESERPEGPYIVEYDEISEIHDLEHSRFRQTKASRFLTFPSPRFTVIVAEGISARESDGHFSPASRQQIVNAAETLELGPERILSTALAAQDLHAEPDAILLSGPHHLIACTWKGRTVRVFLNSYTSLPTAVEWTCAYPDDRF